jgi:hypothetical protein
MPLASASDGVHWDEPNQSFEVKLNAAGKMATWKIGVQVGNAHKFGTSDPSDRSSKPIATLTYDVLWVIDMPNGVKQPCVFTCARSAIKPTQNFISTTRAIGIDQFYQIYQIVVQKKPGPTGDPYFSPEYRYVGNLQDEAAGKANKALYDQYSKDGFITDFEPDDVPASSGPAPTGPMEDDEIPF